MDVLWFRLPSYPMNAGDRRRVRGIGRGRIFVLLERTDYWQSGLVFPKGHYQELRAQGVESGAQEPGRNGAAICEARGELDGLASIEFVVRGISRCPLWHRPGVLVIGDAAHVMSPVGGVGITMHSGCRSAANVLAGPLAAGVVTDAQLAEVQRQREWPTRVIQKIQSFMQERLLAGVLQSQEATGIPWQLKLLVKIPILRDLPAKMLAFGVRRARLAGP